jgi:hypothetical protein
LKSSYFVEKLRLKETAEEDIYFVKRDLDLIEALRKEQPRKLLRCRDNENRRAKGLEPGIAKNRRKPRRLLRAAPALIDEIKAACERH